MKSAVFIERDGVLCANRLVGSKPVSPVSIKEFQINQAALDFLADLKEAGLMLLVTTNQSGLSTGELNRRELDEMHRLLMATFPIDDILVCPHDEFDECPCRKPRTGLFKEAEHRWRLDLDHSFVVSDKWQDAAAAQAVGCTSLLLQSPWSSSGHHDFVLPSLEDIRQKIRYLHKNQSALVAQR